MAMAIPSPVWLAHESEPALPPSACFPRGLTGLLILQSLHPCAQRYEFTSEHRMQNEHSPSLSLQASLQLLLQVPNGCSSNLIFSKHVTCLKYHVTMHLLLFI